MQKHKTQVRFSLIPSIDGDLKRNPKAAGTLAKTRERERERERETYSALAADFGVRLVEHHAVYFHQIGDANRGTARAARAAHGHVSSWKASLLIIIIISVHKGGSPQAPI